MANAKKLKVFTDGSKKSFLSFGHGARGKTIRNPDGCAGWSIRTADFILADGTEVKGLVTLCDMDGGEHYGSGFYLPESNELVDQDDTNEEVARKMGKTKEDVFPYKYRYNGWMEGFDYHINQDTGWSR